MTERPAEAVEPLTDADYAALAGFRAELRRFLAFSEAAARDAGLAPAQHQLLLAVRGHPDELPTTSAVAGMLQLKRHSTTELVARAEANGLVERVVDPDDGRVARLRLTAEGDRLLEALSQVHREELRRMRSELDALLGTLAR